MAYSFRIDRVDTSGLAYVGRRFHAAFTSGHPALREGMDRSADIHSDAIRRRYRVFSAGGGNWRTLAPSTLKRTTNRIGMLRVTDRLYESMGKGSPDHERRQGPQSVTMLTKVRYFGYQHDGTSRIPRRPIAVEANATTMEKITDTLEQSVDRLIQAIFG
jgi:hypothetical protein